MILHKIGKHWNYKNILWIFCMQNIKIYVDLLQTLKHVIVWYLSNHSCTQNVYFQTKLSVVSVPAALCSGVHDCVTLKRVKLSPSMMYVHTYTVLLVMCGYVIVMSVSAQVLVQQINMRFYVFSFKCCFSWNSLASKVIV